MSYLFNAILSLGTKCRAIDRDILMTTINDNSIR